MRKMAKTVALRLAEKAKEEKALELSKDEKSRNLKDNRNKSITNPQPNSNNGPMNRSGNAIRKSDNFNLVKLPKVPAIGSSNTSAKRIW